MYHFVRRLIQERFATVIARQFPKQVTEKLNSALIASQSDRAAMLMRRRFCYYKQLAASWSNHGHLRLDFLKYPCHYAVRRGHSNTNHHQRFVRNSKAIANLNKSNAGHLKYF